MRRPPRLRLRLPARRRGEHGYNMVVLMVLVTVMNVLIAAALPAWSGVIQREKEQELIFRGLQYAEAIRVFQQRFGRLPIRLEELVEVEPRSIRRLWEDPMRGEARWGLIFAGAGTPIPGGGTILPGGEVEEGDGSGSEAAESQAITNDPDQPTQGPISGVYSLAEGETMLDFQGKRTYREWHFTVELVSGGPAQGEVNPGPWTRVSRGAAGARIPDLSSRWIGRPWPRELQQLIQQGAVPGQQGGVPGQPGAPPAEGVPLEQTPPPESSPP